jgi:hypothetical protein
MMMHEKAIIKSKAESKINPTKPSMELVIGEKTITNELHGAGVKTREGIHRPSEITVAIITYAISALGAKGLNYF